MENKSMLLYNIENMANKLVTEYQDVTSHIEHMGLRGAGREEALRKNIQMLLPQKFAVGSGIITDINGKQSKQQDFFVYDAFNSPVFLQSESSCIIPVESVYATIEVKSKLTKEKLKESLHNIKSVKELTHTVLKNSFFIPQCHNVILGTVFAYTSDSNIETIASNFNKICNDIPKEYQPSVICILDKGLIINVKKDGMRQIEIFASDKTTLGIVKNTPEINFYLFYLILQQHLNTTMNFPPDLLKYANATHALDDLQIIIPKGMMPEDASLDIGETKISGNDLRFLQENALFLYKIMTNKVTQEEIEKSGKVLMKLMKIVKRLSNSSSEK